jgi:hypothetical protein
MNNSIIIYGPQGCGKTINADGFCVAFGLGKSLDLDECEAHLGYVPKEGYVLFCVDPPKNTHGIHAMSFDKAIRLVKRPNLAVR